MMSNSALLQNLTLADQMLILLTLVALICVLLLISLYKRSQKVLKDIENYSLQATSGRGLNLLHKAMQKAQSIIGLAEIESIKVAQTSKFETRQLEAKYEASLKVSLTQMENQLQSYLDTLKLASQTAETNTQTFMKQRISQVFENFETKLTELLNQTQAKSFASIELELKSTRSLIDAYKTQQLTLIDENIVAMLEKTLSLVLAKKLTLKDQLDLVYEALEKAKVEKFIV